MNEIATIRRFSASASAPLFHNARSQNGWLGGEVGDAEIEAIYATMQRGPTAANGQPARFVFLRGAAAKERLRPALSPTNVDRTIRNGTLQGANFVVAARAKVFPRNPRLSFDEACRIP